jgi:nitroreductase/NAD-dependent dihydropyrimidine dehydrogenase PreA subunit
MPILGIDYEKCNNCQICLEACSRYFRRDEEQNKIIFDDPQNLCDSCGRCIARCKSEAIKHEDFGEMLTFEGVKDPSRLITYEAMHKFLSSKRSIRGFKNKKIPREVMEKVLNSMKYAPTAANMRNLKCTVISDDDKIKKLSGAVIDAIIATNNPRYSENLKKAREYGMDVIFYNAPHVMIIHSDVPTHVMDTPIGLTYAMLSAQTLGLGSCWIGLAQGVLAASKEIRENIVGIHGKVWGVIIIGYPKQKYYKVPPRPDIEAKGLDELE